MCEKYGTKLLIKWVETYTHFSELCKQSIAIPYWCLRQNNPLKKTLEVPKHRKIQKMQPGGRMGSVISARSDLDGTVPEMKKYTPSRE